MNAADRRGKLPLFGCPVVPFVLAVVLGASSWAADAPPSATPKKPADYRSAIARLEGIVAGELKRGSFSAASIALIDDQQTIHVKGFGFADGDRRVPATAQTVYRAGSISKLFTALAAMQLAEQGKLDIDKPVTGYDSAFRIVNPFDADGPITLRQLMCHRSGMVRESPVGSYFDPCQPPVAATVASIAPCVLVYPPGSRTKYSNVGPTVAGQVVEKVSATPFAQYQAKNLLEPLGMKSSAFLLSDALRLRLATGWMDVADGRGGFRRIPAPRFELGTVPAGNLYTTAEDLGRFASFLLAEGRAGDRRLVKPETLCQMFSVQLTSDKAAYGLGFHVGTFRKHPLISHMGAVYGFTSSLVVLPQPKVAAVVLTNEDIATGPVRKLGDAALGLLLEAKLGEPMPQDQPAQGGLTDPAALAGQYESESYWARIEAAEGKLVADVSGKKVSLTPTGPDKFLADGSLFAREPVEFQRDEKRRAIAFTALTQKFRRVDPAAVPQVPAEWQKFLGSFGPDFIPLIVSVRHGHLYAMTENMADYRLAPLCRTVFKLPPGMYVDEQLVFQVASDGSVPSILFANVPMHRRP